MRMLLRYTRVEHEHTTQSRDIFKMMNNRGSYDLLLNREATLQVKLEFTYIISIYTRYIALNACFTRWIRIRLTEVSQSPYF